MKIGVFDSGIGGLSVARALEKAYPEHDIVFVNDKKHVPYGTKKPAVILGYVVPILENLIKEGCKVIVIACNTVSTTLIAELRERISVPLIAIEPMVKPAAEQTKSGVIAVCATPATLASERYKWLKDTYAPNVKVLEPDCSQWSSMIENSSMDQKTIDTMVNEVCNVGADVIVLGCTHYHWIEDEIKKCAKNRAAVLQPESAITARLAAVLKQLA